MHGRKIKGYGRRIITTLRTTLEFHCIHFNDTIAVMVTQEVHKICPNKEINIKKVKKISITEQPFHDSIFMPADISWGHLKISSSCYFHYVCILSIYNPLE